MDKADPYALRCELPPGTASVIWDLAWVWNDQDWMASRGKRESHTSPMSIYEVHLGSWQRGDDGMWAESAGAGAVRFENFFLERASEGCVKEIRLLRNVHNFRSDIRGWRRVAAATG